MPGLVTVTVNPSFDTTASAPRVEPDKKIRCSGAHRDPGGGGINVARAIHRMGGDATAVWTTGGLFGGAMRGLLEQEAVRHVPVDIEGETRQSFAVIEEDSQRHYRFSTPGPDLGPGDLDAIEAAVERLSPELLVISGGLPATVPAAFYARLARATARAGARVVVDTHGDPLRAALEGGDVSLTKPNYRELLEAAGETPHGGEPDVVEVARRLMDETGTTAILVSLGAAGAVLVTPDDVDRVAAPTVPIRSRIGAGDSMVGGVALRLLHGDELGRAVRYGVAAGTAAVMTPGTELCRRQDVERLFRGL